MKKILTLLATLMASDAAQAQNYMQICARALAFTDINKTDDLAVHYAYLKIKTEEMRTTNKMDTTIDIPGVGSGGYNEAHSEMNRLENELGIKFDVSQSNGLVARYVSKDANETFLGCVQSVLGRGQPVALELVNVTGDQITIRAHVSPNASAKSYHLTFAQMERLALRYNGSGPKQADRPRF